MKTFTTLIFCFTLLFSIEATADEFKQSNYKRSGPWVFTSEDGFSSCGKFNQFLVKFLAEGIKKVSDYEEKVITDKLYSYTVTFRDKRKVLACESFRLEGGGFITFAISVYKVPESKEIILRFARIDFDKRGDVTCLDSLEAKAKKY